MMAAGVKRPTCGRRLRRRARPGGRRRTPLFDPAVELHERYDRRVWCFDLFSPAVAACSVEGASRTSHGRHCRGAAKIPSPPTCSVSVIELPHVIAYKVHERGSKRSTGLLRISGIRLEDQRHGGLAAICTTDPAEGGSLSYPIDLCQAARRLECPSARVQPIPLTVDRRGHPSDAGGDHHTQSDDNQAGRPVPAAPGG